MRCMGKASDKSIGIFDSGIGGLTVYQAIREALPHESLIYLGDTARVPYGTKSSETIIRYSLENASFLIKRGIKALVVACNTSSAYALPAIIAKNGIPVIGVIEPGVSAALSVTLNNNIGVIGTNSTIASNMYAIGIKKSRKDARVVSLACPLFVPLVEEGWVDNDVARLTAEKYLGTLRKEEIDTLILGCTHYPLLKNIIQDVVGKNVKLVDSAAATAKALKDLLTEKKILSESSSNENHIYVTDLPTRFEITARRFVSGDLPVVKRVEGL